MIILSYHDHVTLDYIPKPKLFHHTSSNALVMDSWVPCLFSSSFINPHNYTEVFLPKIASQEVSILPQDSYTIFDSKIFIYICSSLNSDLNDFMSQFLCRTLSLRYFNYNNHRINVSNSSRVSGIAEHSSSL